MWWVLGGTVFAVLAGVLSMGAYKGVADEQDADNNTQPEQFRDDYMRYIGHPWMFGPRPLIQYNTGPYAVGAVACSVIALVMFMVGVS